MSEKSSNRLVRWAHLLNSLEASSKSEGGGIVLLDCNDLRFIEAFRHSYLEFIGSPEGRLASHIVYRGNLLLPVINVQVPIGASKSSSVCWHGDGFELRGGRNGSGEPPLVSVVTLPQLAHFIKERKLGADWLVEKLQLTLDEMAEQALPESRPV